MLQRFYPWQHATFLRLAIPLMAGILCARAFTLPIIWTTVTQVIALVALLATFILIINLRIIPPAVVAGLLYLLVFIMGGLLASFHDMSLRTDFAGRHLREQSQVILRLREPLVEKPATWKAEADIIGVVNGDHLDHTSGRVIVYFQKGNDPPSLHYGDIIITANRLTGITNSGNPGAFDYKRYCHLHNIFYQSYLPAGSWTKSAFSQPDPLQRFFLSCQSWCLKTLSSFIPGRKELGVAEALVVGYRDNLDKDLVQAYANVGVVHIIAISGLHMGLIYLILLFLLRPVPNRGWFGWLKGVIIILGLWCFALTTGAAPSALRASVMFSFFTIARFFIRRNPNNYNTLAASAFVLLCYNPFLLFYVGFQLSYLAVLGILIFQKPIFHLLISKNRALNYVSEMLSLSVAAELLILPLALYYFHQIPLLFLGANLLIIPLASFILYGTVLLLAVSFIIPLAETAGWIVGHAILLMNSIIEWINGLSFSRWSDLSLGTGQTILLYVVIGCLAAWLFHKKAGWLFATLAALFCFSVATMLATFRKDAQKKIIVYNIPRHRAIDFVEGKQAKYVGDPEIVSDKAIHRYVFLPSRVKLQTRVEDTLSHFHYTAPFVQFFNLRFALLDSTFDYKNNVFSLPVDYVFISHNPPVDMEQISRMFSPRQVIFDASNDAWQREKWKTACKKLNLRCFSVPDEGAWILDVE